MSCPKFPKFKGASWIVISELFAFLESKLGVEEDEDDEEEEDDDEEDSEESLFDEKAFAISTTLTIARITKNTISIGCPFFLATALSFTPFALFCSVGALLFSFDAEAVETTLHIKPTIAMTAIMIPIIKRIGA